MKVIYRKLPKTASLPVTCHAPTALGNDFLVLWAIENNRHESLARLCVREGTVSLLDYFVRWVQNQLRDRNADLIRSFQVNDQLKLCRLLDRQIAGLGTF